MQIDFHHAVSYVAARLAGFNHGDADILAYCAQYVDDAADGSCVRFGNGSHFQRISSAHKIVDLRNLDEVHNQLVWLPFHFLPGNCGMAPGQSPNGDFIRKIVCTSNSLIVKEMLSAAIADNEKPYKLHRLGITMHVYADTWAHQGFAGVIDEINRVDKARETGSAAVIGDLHEFLCDVLDNSITPLGHACAQVFPDLPFLQWEYWNGMGQKIVRNNTDLFCEAADSMCRAMQEYRRRKDPAVIVSGIDGKDMAVIKGLFSSLTSQDEKKRHSAWINAINEGVFSFGPAEISYDEESWEHEALGDADEERGDYKYNAGFLTSNWKLFNDALQLHQFTVLRDILPAYGICAG
jgi:hypothetical protein